MDDPENIKEFGEALLEYLEDGLEALWAESNSLSEPMRCTVAANTCIRVASGVVMSSGSNKDVTVFKKEWLELCEQLFDQVYFEMKENEKLTTNEVGDA